MAWSAESSFDSFLMTNMSPQKPDLNQKLWKWLEDAVRKRAIASGKIYVITGPLLKPGLKKIKSGVSIPEKYFKAVYDIKGGKHVAIAFLVPQDYKSKKICDYALPVDRVEEATKIDFFPALPDEIEDKIEAAADCEAWLQSK